MSILAELASRFRRALSGLVDDPEPLLDLLRQSQDARFGDYQANFAMPLGKRLARPPREVAAEIVARVELDDFCRAPEVAGPGFINLKIRDDWIALRLAAAASDSRLGIAEVEQARTYVIDYSAPNVAKPMHVGHIRSTVIGNSLYRTLRFLGHQVISDNHLGDWGTQFGMIIYGYKHFLDLQAYEQDPVEELARLYRLVRQLMDYHEGKARLELLEKQVAEEEAALAAEHAAVGAAVLEETAKLHEQDDENLRLWRRFMPACLEEIDELYKRLDIAFDHTLGESFYQDRLQATVDELVKSGVARESDGAICVFFEGNEVPMIVRKKDGAFLYATTDLATLRYRIETWQPDAILYVVDHRQSLHFEQLFATARLMGYGDVKLEHVSFGTVLGEDGRPFKTRSGDTVGLEGLLDEAVRRAAEIVAANDDAKPGGPELSAEQRARVAETVGIGALKYADLSQNRTSDYVFSYDKMLAMNGNTGTYMQYAYARVRSIFARGNVDVESLRASGTPILLDSPAERALGLELLRFGEALDLVVADYRPNQLTGYLFNLANRYSTFYEQCPVLKAETEAARNSRLLLCDLTARTLRQGLELLGIKVVDKM
ncbi:MAG: arginine--tRNA ligase [Planctomycetes bacterium RBG_16_64_12]|nr:MAG: arginine--tRNA ligase [Planctomycetes bacterium RBG_16_64_12]